MSFLKGGRTAGREVRRAMPADEEAYYHAADTWDADVIRKAKVSRNRAYVFGLASLVVAAGAVFAVASLAPLKRVEVATITFNEQTGLVRMVKYSDDAAKFTSDEGFIKNQINQFVIARETWDMSDMDYRKKQVRLFLAPSLIQGYNEDFNTFKGDALINTLGSRIRRTVKVKEISFLNKTTAHVQFVTDDDNNGQHTYAEWAAVVGFGFTKRPESADDGLINPFGFQVTSYRRDAMMATQ